MEKNVKDLITNREKFNFKYLPAFAAYIMDNHLKEYVTIGIRFGREEDLPVMKPLSKLSEEELVTRSIESNRQALNALVKGKVVDHIEKNLENYLNNKIDIVDKSEIDIADLTLIYFIRRKMFSYFLYGYTQNPSLQQSITYEVDVYTSQEELLTLKAFLYLKDKK
ncbi:MAG: hypothetical protein V4565_11955 [Bacteroidota bacterium]